MRAADCNMESSIVNRVVHISLEIRSDRMVRSRREQSSVEFGCAAVNGGKRRSQKVTLYMLFVVLLTRHADPGGSHSRASDIYRLNTVTAGPSQSISRTVATQQHVASMLVVY
jgi:hypothetical protein